MFILLDCIENNREFKAYVNVGSIVSIKFDSSGSSLIRFNNLTTLRSLLSPYKIFSLIESERVSQIEENIKTFFCIENELGENKL